MRYLDPKNDMTFKKVFGLDKGLLQGRAEGMQEALARLVASGISAPEARKLLGLDS